MTDKEGKTLIKDVSDIKIALLGNPNPNFEQPGLVHEVKKNTASRKQLNRFKWRLTGFIAGVTFIFEAVKTWWENNI